MVEGGAYLLAGPPVIGKSTLGIQVALRRALSICSVAVVAAASLPAPVAGQVTTFPGIEWSRYQLSNGLDVVLAPDPAATEVSVELWIHVGARHEAPGRFGLAHFFEHAMPFGQGMTRTRVGRQLLDSMRTDSNAITRFDYTRFYTQARAEALDLFLQAAADRLRADPVFELTAAGVDAHRRNVVTEIARAAGGTWGWPVKVALHAGTFGAHHPYGHHIYGSEAETRETSADDMLRWFRAHVRPEYTTLIVVGRFDSPDARSAIELAFGGIPGGRRPPRAESTVPAVALATDSVEVAANGSHVFMSWPVPPWGSEERAPLTLIARILTDRLAAGRPPSVQDAVAETEFLELAGRFTVRATFTREADRPGIEAWLRREVTRLLADGVTQRELQAAKDVIVADTRAHMAALGWENSRSELLGEGVIFADDPGAYVLALARVGTVTPAAARGSLQRWLADPGFLLVVRGTSAQRPTGRSAVPRAEGRTE